MRRKCSSTLLALRPDEGNFKRGEKDSDRLVNYDGWSARCGTVRIGE